LGLGLKFNQKKITPALKQFGYDLNTLVFQFKTRQQVRSKTFSYILRLIIISGIKKDGE
jgi:hypothetical protein